MPVIWSDRWERQRQMHNPDKESDRQTARDFVNICGGKGAMTLLPPHAPRRVSRCLALPPPFHKRMPCLPKGNQVARGRGSHIRGKEPQGICWPSSQNRASGIPWLVWGAQCKGWWRGRGSQGHKPWGLNLNITSIKAWPKYCDGEAQFSIQPFLRLELIPWPFYTCSDKF